MERGPERAVTFGAMFSWVWREYPLINRPVPSPPCMDRSGAERVVEGGEGAVVAPASGCRAGPGEGGGTVALTGHPHSQGHEMNTY